MHWLWVVQGVEVGGRGLVGSEKGNVLNHTVLLTFHKYVVKKKKIAFGSETILINVLKCQFRRCKSLDDISFFWSPSPSIPPYPPTPPPQLPPERDPPLLINDGTCWFDGSSSPVQTIQNKKSILNRMLFAEYLFWTIVCTAFVNINNKQTSHLINLSYLYIRYNSCLQEIYFLFVNKSRRYSLSTFKEMYNSTQLVWLKFRYESNFIIKHEFVSWDNISTTRWKGKLIKTVRTITSNTLYNLD